MAKFDIQKEQINNLDVALERYSTDHLMIKDVYIDNENNIVDKKQKTYPEKLDELIDLGYINHIENIDDFEYKPYKKRQLLYLLWTKDKSRYLTLII